MKDPKTFDQKYKTIDGRILTYTPHTAWVQTKGKQSRLLRNSGFAFVPNPLIYGPCCPSTLSDYVAYKSARRTGPCLRFLDIENSSAPRHPMFKEDAIGLPVKLTRKEQQNCPSKRTATGKRTGDDRHKERQHEKWNSSRNNDLKNKVLPHQDQQLIQDRPGRKISRRHPKELTGRQRQRQNKSNIRQSNNRQSNNRHVNKTGPDSQLLPARWETQFL